MSPILSPSDESLDQLCSQLSDNARRWRTTGDWPAESLGACAEAGVYRWFLTQEHGGNQWSAADQTRGYLRLSQADLTTTFIITQYMGAIRRIAGSDNAVVREQWVQQLANGERFGTVGISHLTTSRRHLKKPVLLAEPVDGGYQLNGLAPWVTGAAHADVVVIGATLPDGRELLAAVPTNLSGVEAGPGAELVALSSSCTDKMTFDDVRIGDEMLIAGPIENVMQSGTGARVGGLQTSTLAIGLARAASNYLTDEASRREDIVPAAEEIALDLQRLESTLLDAVSGKSDCDNAEVRVRANRIAMHSTQAAMTAAKGAGFLADHDVGRWCRQALFFLVWSCPQPVAQTHLCELAGIA